MDSERYKKARKRVKAKKEFYEHLTTYVVMSAFFFILDYITSPGISWFYWPMLGWGIGIFFHYLEVFGLPGIGVIDKNWEERAIREEMDKMDRELGKYPRMDNDYQTDEDYLELKELKRKKETRKRWDEGDLV